VSSTEIGIRAGGASSRIGAQDDRPLSDQEYGLVQRLFSDPFSFPLAFKAWLVGYLESSDMSLPMSSVLGLQSTLGITGAGQGTLGTLPAGLIFPYGGSTAPTGSLLCDGASYAKTLQTRLWNAIGYQYGGSEASGQFNVPDLRERVPVGRGNLAAHDSLGDTEGLPLGQRGTSHNHTVRDLGHQHTQANDVVQGGTIPYPTPGSSAGTFGDTATGTTDSRGTGIGVGPGGSAPNDTPAFITINFIIVA